MTVCDTSAGLSYWGFGGAVAFLIILTGLALDKCFMGGAVTFRLVTFPGLAGAATSAAGDASVTLAGEAIGGTGAAKGGAIGLAMTGWAIVLLRNSRSNISAII